MRFTFLGAETTAKANAPAHCLRLPLAPGRPRPPRAAPREPARPPGVPRGSTARPTGTPDRAAPQQVAEAAAGQELAPQRLQPHSPGRANGGDRDGHPYPHPALGSWHPGAAAVILPAPAGGPLFSPPKTPPPGSPALSQAAAHPTGGERRGLPPPAAAPSLAPSSHRRNGRGQPRETLRATADRPASRTRHRHPARDAPPRSALRPAGRDPSPPSPPQKSARRGCPERRSPPGKVTPRRQSPRPRHRGAGSARRPPRSARGGGGAEAGGGAIARGPRSAGLNRRRSLAAPRETIPPCREPDTGLRRERRRSRTTYRGSGAPPSACCLRAPREKPLRTPPAAPLRSLLQPPPPRGTALRARHRQPAHAGAARRARPAASPAQPSPARPAAATCRPRAHLSCAALGPRCRAGPRGEARRCCRPSPAPLYRGLRCAATRLARRVGPQPAGRARPGQVWAGRAGGGPVGRARARPRPGAGALEAPPEGAGLAAGGPSPLSSAGCRQTGLRPHRASERALCPRPVPPL
ncbi:basic proline-rich protein-like [Zonotrichia leucophrys gambelii]|uniref:basic proline-rich protein-like n=1 Tax=Zonotrichia leucophrys gambelii TaxID=257770 RepID=UPI0031406C1B